MNKTKIEWCDYTWNPVVGCKHGCKYCYARRLNDRFKWIEKWTEPQYYPDRLAFNFDTIKCASIVFVGSMCDLFGGWVDRKWIEQTIEVANYYGHLQFMFLTKNPMRYSEFEFNSNCWLGATVEKWNEIGHKRITDLLSIKTPAKKYLSIEPLLGDFGIKLDSLDLIIVGAMTGTNAVKPEKEWIESIKHHNIFYKNNIKEYL